MARKKHGRLTGKIGPTVSYTINGVEVTRVYQADVHDPITPLQLLQRTKMKFTSKLLTTLKRTIDYGYQATQADNPSNEARKFISKNCYSVNGMEVTVHFDKMVVARGTRLRPEDCSISFNDGHYTVSWKPWDAKSGLNPEDRLNIVMFSDCGKYCLEWHKFLAVKIPVGSYTSSIPQCESPIHIWIFFSDGEVPNKTSPENITNSVYLGTYPPNAPLHVLDAGVYGRKEK